MFGARFLLIIGLGIVHLASIYLFTSGFLLTRLALSDINTCSGQSCTLTATHKRAVLIIIDSLRFDFVSPHPPDPPSPYHHAILTLPSELTASQPDRSFLFNAYADPPTTTLQRIKGITTGSLPTFVDLGNNFGASSIAEDSIINQLSLRGKKVCAFVAFMGDDTWMSVFPDALHPNMTFPFDSFNVEDLHTVDNGVTEHIFPLLEDDTKPFDFLVAHFLGVDHVGHRVGPDHPSMQHKLQQMDTVLRNVVDKLDTETLLVVLGDHGMDAFGDHGGDGVPETSTALWIYSKGRPIATKTRNIPSALLEYVTFPGEVVPHRRAAQIDLVPTLALLLGLPIPFNNLGQVIPELFWRDPEGTELHSALQINAAQIRSYLEAYHSSGAGSDLDDVWGDLQNAWNATSLDLGDDDKRLAALSTFNRAALNACRSIWAQFNPVLMGMGLALLAMSLAAAFAIYFGVASSGDGWSTWLIKCLRRCAVMIAVGPVLGYAFHATLQLHEATLWECILFASVMLACVSVVVQSPFPPTRESFSAISLPLILHTAIFFSNSFTFWEDHVIPFLSLTSLVPFVVKGVNAHMAGHRHRILSFAAIFAISTRIMALSTVCREEQQPYCNVTFYATSSLPSPPPLALILAVPAACTLPFVLKRFMRITQSHRAMAPPYLHLILTPVLLGGAFFWMLEWLTSSNVQPGWSDLYGKLKFWVARLSLGWAFVPGLVLLWLSPICIDVNVLEEPRRVTVIGYANAFGASYILFWSWIFGVVYLTTQLAGQIVLFLAVVALLSYLEMVDAIRDAEVLENTIKQSPANFAEVVPIALLALQVFYATGHQSTIPSIQWKSAFVLSSTVIYPFSPMTVTINFFGPTFVVAMSAALLSAWKRSPVVDPSDEHKGKDVQVQGDALLAGLAMMIYYECLLLGAAGGAAILRRHLMVWKIFAPRYMAAAAEMLVVDLAILLSAVVLSRIKSVLSRHPVFGWT
ncbi:alkaline phosphatase-like protein [Fistulina hepatica ATCC 64428]|uniref:Alkaline phosphatase-like protein n=1 Tax=Fistulina hepatica ATCC 64428 TaxID=1128425 RepID=A0A0D7A0M1_9AGAR|nr:alkaline phosphatase-like protein [Fistulina hepatica ATCC 64428]